DGCALSIRPGTIPDPPTRLADGLGLESTPVQRTGPTPLGPVRTGLNGSPVPAPGGAGLGCRDIFYVALRIFAKLGMQTDHSTQPYTHTSFILPAYSPGDHNDGSRNLFRDGSMDKIQDLRAALAMVDAYCKERENFEGRSGSASGRRSSSSI